MPHWTEFFQEKMTLTMTCIASVSIASVLTKRSAFWPHEYWITSTKTSTELFPTSSFVIFAIGLVSCEQAKLLIRTLLQETLAIRVTGQVAFWFTSATYMCRPTTQWATTLMGSLFQSRRFSWGRSSYCIKAYYRYEFLYFSIVLNHWP